MTATPMPHMPLFPAFTARRNAALSAAVDDLDGYAEAEAGRQGIADALAAASSDLLAASQARMALVDALAATAAAGKQIRNDLPTKAAKTAAAIASARETVIVLQEADRQLAESREVVLTAAPSRLMRHLHGQLEATLNEARALGLDRVHDAEDAIASAKTEAAIRRPHRGPPRDTRRPTSSVGRTQGWRPGIRAALRRLRRRRQLRRSLPSVV